MNDQLRKFLELEDLSPSQFAEIMGIQRSSVSHILSERNKPSYDFIERMLSKFPQISAEWLILGKGKPYKEQNVQSEEKSTAAPHYNLFSQPTENKETTPQIGTAELSQTSISDDISTTSHEIIKENVISEPLPTTIECDTPRTFQMPIKKESSLSSEKKIVRITIFYSDGTFEER